MKNNPVCKPNIQLIDIKYCLNIGMLIFYQYWRDMLSQAKLINPIMAQCWVWTWNIPNINPIFVHYWHFIENISIINPIWISVQYWQLLKIFPLQSQYLFIIANICNIKKIFEHNWHFAGNIFNKKRICAQYWQTVNT